MKLLVIGYVPSPDVINARDFMAHIGHHKPEHELILFSNHSWPGVALQLHIGPELVKNLGAVGMENILFFTAARIAQNQNATHFLYIDHTCRFSSWAPTTTWDRLIFDQFFLQKPYAAVGGSMVINQMTGLDLRWMERCAAQATGDSASGVEFPPVQYIDSHLTPAVFVNGPLAVYSCHWVREIFGDINHSINLCHEIHPHPYSYWIGHKLREKMGEDVFKAVLHMDRLFSTVKTDNDTGQWRDGLIHGDENVCAVNGIY